jgi:hypothetical protein
MPLHLHQHEFIITAVLGRQAVNTTVKLSFSSFDKRNLGQLHRVEPMNLDAQLKLQLSGHCHVECNFKHVTLSCSQPVSCRNFI